MIKILVTGGLGYIGSYFINMLNDYQVTIVDNVMFGQNIKNIFHNKKINFQIGDVNDFSFMKKFYKENDIIIPLAAIVGAPLCDKKPIGAKNTNQISIKKMSEFLSTNQKIIMPVTNSGYGIGETNAFCTEESPLNPISLYGRTKVEAEKIIIQRENSISLRLATVFGVNKYRMRNELMVNNFTYNAVIKKKFELFEPNFRRNFIHIFDVCRAFLYCIENWNNMKSEIYNLGIDDANKTKKELCEILKNKIPDFNFIINNNQKDPDQRDYFVSNEKIRKKGFFNKISLDEGIEELISYYKN